MTRGAALRVIDKVELAPAPAFRIGFHFVSERLAFDRGDLKSSGGLRRLALGPGVVGTAVADDSNRIGGVRAEPKRPQQTAREDAAFHLAVVRAVANFDDVAIGELAMELLRAAFRFRFDELAIDDLIRH